MAFWQFVSSFKDAFRFFFFFPWGKQWLFVYLSWFQSERSTSLRYPAGGRCFTARHRILGVKSEIINKKRLKNYLSLMFFTFMKRLNFHGLCIHISGWLLYFSLTLDIHEWISNIKFEKTFWLIIHLDFNAELSHQDRAGSVWWDLIDPLFFQLRHVYFKSANIQKCM